MSPQLYPTPPDPTANSSSSSNLSQSRSGTLYRNRWPLLFTTYLVLGGVPMIPTIQRRLNPRTANLLRTGSLIAVVLGAVGLTAYDVLGNEMDRRGMGKLSVSADATKLGTGQMGSEVLSDEELRERRDRIEKEGLQRD